MNEYKVTFTLIDNLRDDGRHRASMTVVSNSEGRARSYVLNFLERNLRDNVDFEPVSVEKVED